MITLYALAMDLSSDTGVTNKKTKCNCNLISFILVISLIVSQLIVKIVTFIIICL